MTLNLLHSLVVISEDFPFATVLFENCNQLVLSYFNVYHCVASPLVFHSILDDVCEVIIIHGTMKTLYCYAHISMYFLCLFSMNLYMVIITSFFS